MDLSEARRILDSVLGDEVRTQYFSCLRQWCLFSSTLTLEQLDAAVRKILTNKEQYKCHKNYILALQVKTGLNMYNGKHSKPVDNKNSFEMADFNDYVPPLSYAAASSSTRYRSAAAELFTPDSEFVMCRTEIAAWKNGLEGPGNDVNEVIAFACKVFLKNIITAMITKAKSYKVRDGKFQYGFNMPIPDPFLRNSRHIFDESLESKVDTDEGVLFPTPRISFERAEQEVAYAYGAARNVRTGVTLNKKLLFKTIVDNPQLLGVHSIHSVNVLKLGLDFDDNEEKDLLSDEESD
ncbi:transcriptional adapter 1-like [Sitophilus oryzae]|uniref:Transcriptional adapter 1-like n=1 Tax=Sitophilus oryzae TaxID=7048 RepID=A0A6J2XMI8_SITOR|nr:transcriptional adapter 1-like [Sitophilus oryzae]